MIDDLIDLGTRRISRNLPMRVIIEVQAVMAADAGLRGLVALANFASHDGVVTIEDGVKALKRFTEGPEGEHAVFNGDSKITIDGDKVSVRTEDLRTVLNCDRPKIVGGIVSILHGWILKSRGSTKDDRADGYDAGLRAFAWWKDGVQYVGTSGTTLTEAIRKGERDAPSC